MVLAAVALLAGVAIGRFALVPAPQSASEEEHHGEAREVALDEMRIRAARIDVASVVAGDLADQVIAQATVAAAPDGAAIIGARADGTVTAITKRLGDAVAKGERLGAIQSREAASLAGERASAQSRLVRALATYERQKNLLAANATSRQEHDAARSEWQVAQAEARRAGAAAAASGLSRDGISLDILSPISGRVTTAPAVMGAYVIAGAELFRVADPSRLEVQAAVPAAEAMRIVVGASAVLDLPQGAVAATVRAITPDVGLQSRAATVVLTLRNGAGQLQPGQMVSARISVAHGHSAAAMLVPSAAVQRFGGENVVFLRTARGFRMQPVTAGGESGEVTEIRAGLKPGDRVATANAFLLRAELEKDSAGHED